MSERFVVAQFCDDVRRELGNKYSLMGCYADTMLFDNFPVIFGKLCVQIKVITPRTKPFERIVFRLKKDHDVIAELEAEHFTIPTQNLDYPESRYGAIGVLVITPLPLEQETVLLVEAETESEVLDGPRLYVRKQQSID